MPCFLELLVDKPTLGRRVEAKKLKDSFRGGKDLCLLLKSHQTLSASLHDLAWNISDNSLIFDGRMSNLSAFSPCFRYSASFIWHNRVKYWHCALDYSWLTRLRSSNSSPHLVLDVRTTSLGRSICGLSSTYPMSYPAAYLQLMT